MRRALLLRQITYTVASEVALTHVLATSRLLIVRYIVKRCHDRSTSKLLAQLGFRYKIRPVPLRTIKKGAILPDLEKPRHA